MLSRAQTIEEPPLRSARKKEIVDEEEKSEDDVEEDIEEEKITEEAMENTNTENILLSPQDQTKAPPKTRI